MSETPEDATARVLAFARDSAGKPYVPPRIGPSGYDCSGFVSEVAKIGEPHDWNAHVRRDRVGAIRTLIRIELRYRRRLACEHVAGWVIDRLSR